VRENVHAFTQLMLYVACRMLHDACCMLHAVRKETKRDLEREQPDKRIREVPCRNARRPRLVAHLPMRAAKGKPVVCLVCCARAREPARAEGCVRGMVLRQSPTSKPTVTAEAMMIVHTKATNAGWCVAIEQW
jgi:hypothetical protein